MNILSLRSLYPFDLFSVQFIVDNGKEIVAQQGWREKLKVKFDEMALLLSFILHLQAYPEIMADMFEAMTRQPAKRQRLN